MLDSDEILGVLRPLVDKAPIYLLIERLQLYKPPVKRIVNPEYQKRIQQLKWDQVCDCSSSLFKIFNFLEVLLFDLN